MFKLELEKPGLLPSRVVFPMNVKTEQEVEALMPTLVGRQYGGIGVIFIYTGEHTYHVFSIDKPDGIVTIKEY